MRRKLLLGLFLPPKIDFFHSFFEVPIFYRFWSVLGGFGESLGRVWGEFWKGLGRVWRGLERVWEDFGDEILKPLAKRGTAGGLRSALLNKLNYLPNPCQIIQKSFRLPTEIN